MKKIIVDIARKRFFGKDDSVKSFGKNDPKRDWKFCYHCQTRVELPCDSNDRVLNCERF